MTTNQPNRLDRVESLLERFIAASEFERVASNERLTRLEVTVNSNSRSIQALTDDIAEFKLAVAEDRERAAEERRELREAMVRLTDVSEGIANLVSRLDEDQPTILRKLNTIENKVDRLLEQGDGGQQIDPQH